MNDNWDSEFVEKTKRTYACGYCDGEIPAGTSCYKEMGFHDGEFKLFYLCHRCKSLVADIDEYPLQALSEIFDEVIDLATCPQCGDRAPEALGYQDEYHLYVELQCTKCQHKYVSDMSAENISAILKRKNIKRR